MTITDQIKGMVLAEVEKRRGEIDAELFTFINFKVIFNRGPRMVITTEEQPTIRDDQQIQYEKAIREWKHRRNNGG